jgi:hypothetical protein
MFTMTANKRTTPLWLASLMDQVEVGLERLTVGKLDLRPALEHELKQIKENTQGWSTSLANSKLPLALREVVEKEWSVAIERQHEIEAELSELTQKGICSEQLVEPQQVIDRLDRLADVLATNGPTRGNLELSLHIDRIICHRDDRVILRMCKLGIMPDAVELLAMPVVKPPGEQAADPVRSRARRRGKLRVVDDNAEVDLRAQANFIADSDRFKGLGEEWFWIDEFAIPAPTSWVKENADAVFQRRQATRFSYAQLAREFEVTPPTIGAAIRCYLKTHPGEKDEVCLQRGGKRRPKFDLGKMADEARQLWIEGVSKEKLAKKYGCSAPTVHKAIAFAYTQEGLPMPTREEARHGKVIEARRLLDEGQRLEAIAAAMKISDVTVRRYLHDSFAAEGKSMPDLRRRSGA